MSKYLVCVTDCRHKSYETERNILENAGISLKCESRVEKSGKRRNKLIELNHHECDNMGNSTYQTVLHRLPSL